MFPTAIRPHALRCLNYIFGMGLSLFVLPAVGDPLSLEQAWQLAEQSNPALRSTRAGIEAYEGAAKDAQAMLWNNPEVSGDAIRHQLPSSANAHEWHLGISQTFELAGQQTYRREATQQDLAAAQTDLDEIRRQLRAEVGQRFIRVLGLQSRIAMEQETVNLIGEAAVAVQKRARVGEDTKLEGNLAAVEVVRANNQIAVLREELISARAELASLLQLTPGAMPEATGELQQQSVSYSLEQLLSSAAARAQLQSLEHKRIAAEKRLALERAAAYPDVTVGLSMGQEGPSPERENLTGISVSVPLPIFRRNAGGIGRAMSELTQADIDKSAAERDIKAQVIALWSKFESTQNRVNRLQQSILPSLEENQRLSAKAFRAGELGLIELLMVSRQTLDGRRDELDAEIEYAQTRIALEQAAGWAAPTIEPQVQQQEQHQ